VLVVAGLAVAGASAGFIPWNFPRARVFMGDVGSYSVGFLLGALVLLTFVITGSATLSLAPLSVLLCDSAVTLARRIARGDPPMAAHPEHVKQRLPGAGKGSPLPALVVSSVTVLCLAAALLPLTGTLAVWAVLLSVYLSLPRLLGSAGKRRVGVR
jgi:UDP-N-acetylmuramyl pentapeptide phosphotransferase/UDP-N-acetylglucosamine-1-phosphate transferase